MYSVVVVSFSGDDALPYIPIDTSSIQTYDLAVACASVDAGVSVQGNATATFDNGLGNITFNALGTSYLSATVTWGNCFIVYTFNIVLGESCKCRICVRSVSVFGFLGVVNFG